MLKEYIKNNDELLRLAKLGLWLFSLLKTPYKAIFTLYYLVRLKRCGVPVDFSTTMILRNPSKISIGSNCSFSNFVIIDAHDEITIGDFCMFANNTVLATATHDYTINPMNSSMIRKPVKIENNVWFGVGATVMPGITVGEGSVIGARALVTKDVPRNAIVTGIPAKVVKLRDVA